MAKPTPVPSAHFSPAPATSRTKPTMLHLAKHVVYWRDRSFYVQRFAAIWRPGTGWLWLYWRENTLWLIVPARLIPLADKLLGSRKFVTRF